MFLNDISKQTLDDLITFMYSGEVSVNQKNVDAFLDIAKAFKIKGLFDDSDENASRQSSPVPHGSQYRSTQTVPVRVQDQNNYNSALSINHPRASLDEFELENLDKIDQFGYDSPIETAASFDVYDKYGEDETMDQQYTAQDDEWNSHQDYEVDVVAKHMGRVVGKLE